MTLLIRYTCNVHWLLSNHADFWMVPSYGDVWKECSWRLWTIHLYWCTGRAEPHSDIVYSRLLDMYRRDIPRYEVLSKVARSSFSLYYERYKYVFDTTWILYCKLLWQKSESNCDLITHGWYLLKFLFVGSIPSTVHDQWIPQSFPEALLLWYLLHEKNYIYHKLLCCLYTSYA